MDVLRECRGEEGAGQPTMEVLVETLTGTAFEMTVSPSDTIFAIKSKIFRVEGIPISQQHLLYNLKELDDSSSLREHAIGDGARLRLVLGMRGGPISTRRLPPPAPDHTEPWPDIERLLESSREEGDCAGGGCKVTVLVFRDGERVNMLRVRENNDGTYSPLDTNRCFRETSTASTSTSTDADAAADADECAAENAVTQSKMQEIRRRMEMLSLQRQTDRTGVASPKSPSAVADVDAGGCAAENAVTRDEMQEIRRRMEMLALQRQTDRTGHKADIQKTRSEETLSVPSLLGACMRAGGARPRCPRAEYDCAFADRFTLPPLISPIGTRPQECEQEVKLSETLAGSILVKREGVLDECRLRAEPIPAADYGGGGVAWGAAHSASASSLQLRAPAGAVYSAAPSDVFSASTSDLEQLKRNSSRILPALSRHRPREHLHLSDEQLHLHAPAPTPRAPDAERLRGAGCRGKKARTRCGVCHKRLSVAAVHTCRCGADHCAAHRYAEAHACPERQRQAPRLPKI